MSILVWSGFVIFIVSMVLLDLGVFHRKSRVISIGEALAWTFVWVALALAFNVLVYFLYEEDWLGWSQIASHHLTGQQATLQFFTGYLIEKSLSIDNIFVIAMIFAFFHVPLAEQHRVLFWGIMGALVLRGLMIGVGAVLISQFEWTVYFFGALLIFSAVKMLVARHDNVVPEKNFFIRLVRRFYPVSNEFDGSKFFTVKDGRRAMTPLMLTLILVETSDVMFAVDSIPAIFAVTRDPFLVFTSNIFAILGLRSLYFALAGMMEKFRYLQMSLVFLLAYVGVKMILSRHHPIPNGVSLAIIGGILFVGIMASVWASARDTAMLASPLSDEMGALAITAYRQARRVVVLLVGSSVLLVGIALLVLPGPAVVVIPIGLAILSAEFAWARRWLRKMRDTVGEVQQQITKSLGPKE